MNKALFTAQQELYLTQIKIPLRLSCLSGSGWPTVLSLWYLYEGGKLFCATQENAHVVDYLRQTPRCGFEIASDDPPYCGIRGRGTVTVQTDIGREILERLLQRYTGGLQHDLAQKLLAKSDTEVAIVISPHTVTTWNYAHRMSDIDGVSYLKLCPD